jgi:hypothetical protein
MSYSLQSTISFDQRDLAITSNAAEVMSTIESFSWIDSLPKLYLSSISYSLHSTGFDQRELAFIQRSPFGAIISAMA